MNNTAICSIVLALLFFCGFGAPALAQQEDEKIHLGADSNVDYSMLPRFGGSNSVGGQVRADHENKTPSYRFEGLGNRFQPYYDFKQRVKNEYGLSFAGDYNLLYQEVSNSMEEDDAAGGVLRFYGTWNLTRQNSKDSGSLIFKVENRHRLYSDIAPQQLGGEAGYAGLTAITFSDAGSLLSNLYWQQSFKQNRLAMVAGIVDSTDYVDVYGFVNPWTDFINLSFSTSPTNPAPNQGLGAALRTTFSNNYYLLAGLTDANGEPDKPQNSFDSFFDDHEYYKHIELGWMGSWENRFTDNIHLTAWQVDERTAAMVKDGWGLAFSFSKKLGNSWLPFFRAGYSDDGGALLDRSISTGVGYFRQQRSDVFGVGVNWGKPSESIYGPAIDDQYTFELFYRLQLFEHVTITPDIQYLINPPLSPDDDNVVVLGLRARINF